MLQQNLPYACKLSKGNAMPNVEIHGLNRAQAEEIREAIFRIFNWHDLVVTIIGNTDTTDRTGESHPFLRIWDDKYGDNLEGGLSMLKMDMEFPPLLRRFIPAKSAS
jgi:hypothetical protein